MSCLEMLVKMWGP